MDIQQTVTGTEPLTATEVKNYLKIDFATDDDFIGDLISGVRQMAEEICGRSFVASTYILFEYDYEQIIDLPYPEHDSVTAISQNGDNILSDCIITGNYEKVIKLPTVYNELATDDDGIQITYTTLGNCPEGVKNAMLKIIAEIYEKRGNTFEGSVAQLTENGIAQLIRFTKL